MYNVPEKKMTADSVANLTNYNFLVRLVYCQPKKNIICMEFPFACLCKCTEPILKFHLS